MPDPASHSLLSSAGSHIPCLTPDELRVDGRLKSVPEDFIVEELPAYEPGGEGEHLFLWIQKRDVSAEHLVSHIARQLGISREQIGVAGLKDRHAITRQWVSVPASASQSIEAIDNEQIQVLRAALHRNKLRPGHLRGNRFEILIRRNRQIPSHSDNEINEKSQTATADASKATADENELKSAKQILRLIQEQGVPNYFGEQRFGVDGGTLALGFALLKGEASSKQIPYKRRKFLTRLALSAAQSSLFNAVLRMRMEEDILHTVQQGEVMQVRASGGLFLVEDTLAEQARFQARETVMTGPLFGPKMKTPTGIIFEKERAILAAAGLTMDHFRLHKKLTPGGRRPLLLWPDELKLTNDPCGLRLCFSLPSGAYATVVLKEFMKSTQTEDR